MLVLSRRTAEKIVLPAVNTTIQIVAIKPGVVRLGIEAPPDMKVLREELLHRPGETSAAAPSSKRGESLRQLNHLVRNRLNTATIGLALVRRQMNAGLLDAVEQTLRTVEQELEGLRDRVEEESRPRLPSPPPARRKALVVEDDRNECELLAGFLRMAGLDVSTAGDGAAALDHLQAAGRPDVVLLDMALPRFDGPSTVRAIRRDPAYAGLKIFAVSGFRPSEFAVATGPGGIDRWFHKPLNPEVLLRELGQELDPPVAQSLLW
jgi:carbon storage regulator CsrA